MKMLRLLHLQNHCLYYYKTQSDLEATGIIELHNVKTEPFVESTEAVGLLSKIKPETFAAPGYADALKDKSGFVITTDKKKYFMMPQHSAIVTNWLDSIKVKKSILFFLLGEKKATKRRCLQRSEKDWMDQAMKRTGLQHERLSDARTAKAVAQMMRANPTTPTTSSSSAAPAASASATSQSTSSVSSTSSSINNNVPNIFAAADVDAFSELLKDLDAWCENMPDDDEDSDTEA